MMRARLWPLFKLRMLSTKVSTVDPKQMEYFDEISKVWWDKNGIMVVLHQMNDIRIPWIQNRLTEMNVLKSDVDKTAPLRGVSILEVGCGGGFLTEPLSQMGGNVTGLDPNVKLFEIAKSRAESLNLPNLRYLCSTVEEHAVDYQNKYDVVIAAETIEHVKEQEMFVKYCVQCLKPGGSIFVTTNSKSWLSKFIFITIFEKVLRYLPEGTHHYDMFIDIKELIDFLKKENCETVFTKGMMYDFFTKKWYFTKNENLMNYALHAVKAK